jgi:hypothetical protein
MKRERKNLEFGMPPHGSAATARHAWTGRGLPPKTSGTGAAHGKEHGSALL